MKIDKDWLGCTHEFCVDVTAPVKKLLSNFGVQDSPERVYYFQVCADGTAQLCDSTDGSAGIVFDLPDLRYCPRCGRKYREEQDPERYTAFLVDGAFVDAADAYTDVLRFDRLDLEAVMRLLGLAVDNEYDMVVRGCPTEETIETEE